VRAKEAVAVAVDAGWPGVEEAEDPDEAVDVSEALLCAS